MRVVFMGTPAFAVPALHALARAHDVVAVYTRPDKPAGRGKTLTPSPVKREATELGLTVLQPATLRTQEAAATLAELEPDVVCVAAYGLILPPAILETPAWGCINIHGSLLPRWRGAAPVERAILAGDTETGVSIMRMEEGLDTGPYAAQVAIPIHDHDAETLASLLAETGAAALLDVLSLIRSGHAVWTEQDGSLATYAEKITREDVALAPSLPVTGVLRRVLASSRRAPARIRVGEAELTVVRAVRSDVSPQPGAISCSADTVVIGADDGGVALVEVTPAGRKPMPASAWARGARLTGDERWSRA